MHEVLRAVDRINNPRRDVVVIQHGDHAVRRARLLADDSVRREGGAKTLNNKPFVGLIRRRAGVDATVAVLPDRRARLRVGLAHRAAAAPREPDRDRRLLAVVLDLARRCAAAEPL